MLEQLLLARTLSKSKTSSISAPGQGPCSGGSPGGCMGRLRADRMLQSPAQLCWMCFQGNWQAACRDALGRLIMLWSWAWWQLVRAGVPTAGALGTSQHGQSPLGVLRGLGHLSHLSNGVQHGAAPPLALAPSPPTATLQTRRSKRAHNPVAGTAMVSREGCCDKGDG